MPREAGLIHQNLTDLRHNDVGIVIHILRVRGAKDHGTHILLKFQTTDLGTEICLRRRGAGHSIQKDVGAHNRAIVIDPIHVLQPQDALLHPMGEQRQHLSGVAIKGRTTVQGEHIAQ